MNEQEQITKGLAVKNDADKPDVTLIDPQFMLEVARVLGHGNKKYGRNNWKKGLTANRLLAAVLRHTLALVGGEDKDKETGLSHAAHAACGLMMFHWTMANKSEINIKEGKKTLDDRDWESWK
jgi:hypothetical protein